MILAKPFGRPIGGDDTDKNASLLRDLTVQLQEKSLEELKTNCLAIESYMNSKRAQPLIGGLHDYIGTMEKPDCIKYILKSSLKHKELLDKTTFEQVVGSSSSKMIFLSTEPTKVGKMGGLHDYIYRTDRKTLSVWALTAEKYERTLKNVHYYGGVHDRLPNMSDLQIAEYVLEKAQAYPELDSKTKLNTLSSEYGINYIAEVFLDVLNFEAVEPPHPIGAGGLHDYIFRENRETLIKWALASESYDREARHIHVLGGLDDYVNTLSNSELAAYVLEKASLYKELDSREKLNTLSVGISIPVDHGAFLQMDGGLEDYIFRTDRDTLINWALAAEKYDREVLNEVGICGGLHDYVSRLNNTEIAEYIMNKASAHKELNSAAKLNELTTKYSIKYNENEHSGLKAFGGLEDYIFRQPREKLINWALTSEKFYRNAKNMTLVMGGLHDYVARLNNTEIANYILEKASEFKELNSASKLDTLSTQFGINYTEGHKFFLAFLDNLSVGGLEDYIFRENRTTLVNWALAAEKYHRQALHQEGIMGGLHDYIARLNNSEIAEYIMNKASIHNELNSNVKLDELTTQYGIKYNSEEHSVLKAFGGLEDYIFRQPREKLVQWALASEKYSRAEKNITLMGGLHDYIARLNDTEIANYILEKAKESKALNSADKLDRLVSQYASEHKVAFLAIGGLHDYIYQTDRATLTQWALTAEKHWKSMKHIDGMGGLDDYVWRLTDKEIADYVLKMAAEFPELDSKTALNKFAVQYGVTKN